MLHSSPTRRNAMPSLPERMRNAVLTATVAVASLGAACDKEGDRPEALMDTTFLSSGDVFDDSTRDVRVRALPDSSTRGEGDADRPVNTQDRKSTRLNSSH